VCAPCYYPFRYGGSENANTRVSVYLYCVIIARLCLPDNGKDVKSHPRVPFSFILIHIYIYTYTYYYTLIFIHVADGFMFFDTVNSLAHIHAHTYTQDLRVCIFEHKVLIGLDIVKIPRKSLLGFWT